LNGIASLFFACIEFILLINVLIFSEKSKINIMGIILIVLLTIYQALEFAMCARNLQYSYMAYLAFADISFLPPLNLYLILSFLGYKNKLFKIIFIPAVAFTIYYYFSIDKFAVVSCTVLYASYSYPLGNLFGFFYYLPIFAAIIMLFNIVNLPGDDSRKNLSKILLGGLGFISIPTLFAFFLLAKHNYRLLEVIESIMCKFAFVYAVCLGYFILRNKANVHE
jgi:hypothetical protein